MKKAEVNLKKVFQNFFNKNDKDLDETKRTTTQFNEKVLQSIKEIKENLIQRINNRKLLD